MKKLLYLLTAMMLVLFTSCGSTSTKVKIIDIKLTDENYAYVV